MTMDLLALAIVLAAVVVCVVPLGSYMARVFTGERVFLTRLVAPVERGWCRLLGTDPEAGQDWKAYAKSVVAFSVFSWLALYLILRTQTIQPWNPEGFHSGTWDVSFNTASSFVTNTNWQYYGGETTLTYFAQMAGLTVQNFVSAAVGIAVAIAVIRGLANRSGKAYIGNFWVDLFRAVAYILVPISFVLALILVSQGVLQTLSGYVHLNGVAAGVKQTLALGPVASQEAIKELGTNGGGFFNVNSAMPFENSNGLTNALEIWLILLIPAALTATYGRMVGSRRQGWAIFGAMSVLFLASVAVVFFAERHATPAQQFAGILHSSGNMEGKEVRFGTAGSALWAAVTTVTSCGAVNAAFESLTALGGVSPFSGLSVSEVVFGGVGSGLYVMLIFVILAVFIGGLMVGRTPEFLGKKIEAREMKLATLTVLVTPLAVLVTAGAAVASKYGKPSIFASGPQGFSESLYAYLSQANNNGSAFAGYTGYYQPVPGNVGAHGITFADLLGGVTMLGARFLPMILVLAVAGSLAAKRVVPAGAGTLRTDTPTFVVLLIAVVLLLGALTFFPAILLGPVVQALTNRLF
ncbi:MAG TPA: potassium-transporting ATPase subunit KdpA [Solirubrobacteraceae bacterium]